MGICWGDPLGGSPWGTPRGDPPGASQGGLPGGNPCPEGSVGEHLVTFVISLYPGGIQGAYPEDILGVFLGGWVDLRGISGSQEYPRRPRRP